MGKKMMILGASALQVPAIRAAKDLGYEVISVDYDPNAVGFALADTVLVVSTMDKEEVLRQAEIHKPDIILTSTSDGPVRTAAYVNEKLGKRPDLSYEDSLCATIKSHMRKRLSECHVPVPTFFAVRSKEEFLKAVDSLSGYCIVKPADNAGSRGVVLLDNTDGAKDREELLKIYDYSLGNSRDGELMVEEVMTGPEVSVEALTIEGETTIVAVTDKMTTPLPYFVEIGHCEPSRLPAKTIEEIKELALKAVKAIRLQNGPSHTEIKVTPDGPKIVELAARLGGDFITSKLVPLSTGIDLVTASIRLAAHLPVDLTQTISKGAAIRFLQAPAGTLKELSADKELENMPGIIEVRFYCKEGDKVCGLHSSNDRIGHIIAQADTPEKAARLAEDAMKHVRILVQP